MDWKGKRVFITGAFGFVGKNLAMSLIEKEANVYLLRRDEEPVSRSFFSKFATVVTGDITDLDLMKRIITGYEIDYVFHLAAQPIVDIAVQNPLETFQSNILGTANVLEACRLRPVKAVVIASSEKAYGTGKIPYKETYPLQGTAPYDVSKSCADLIAQTYFKTYAVPVVITRCANIYGPQDYNFSRLVPDAIRCAVKGNTLEMRSDGNFIRDFIYVKEVVNAYLLCAEKVDKAKGQAYNFGTGEKFRVIDVVNMVFKIVGNKKASIKILNTAKHEIKDQYLDASKAKKELGWKPKYSMDDALKETIEWYKAIL